MYKYKNKLTVKKGMKRYVARRRIAVEFWILYNTNVRPRAYQKPRNRHRVKLERKSKRNSNKGIKIVLRESEKRNKKEFKTLVRYRIRRKRRQNSPTRNIFWAKKCGTYTKTLEVRLCQRVRVGTQGEATQGEANRFR